MVLLYSCIQFRSNIGNFPPDILVPSTGHSCPVVYQIHRTFLSHPPDILAEPPDILVPSTGHSCQQACKCEAACEAGARPLFQNLTLYEHYIEHLYEQRVLRNLFLKILENGSTAGRET